jgi:IS5 family transposase
MNDGHGHYVIGYNAQVAVDSESTFIAASVVTSDANDMGQMPAVMDAIKEVAGEYPVEVVADSGYDSSPNHQALVERQVISYIRPRSST